MHILKFSNHFEREFEKLIKYNKSLEKKVDICLLKLAKDPYESSLRTHLVNARLYGRSYSSSVSGDIRIIWQFDGLNKYIISIINIGGHSGSKSVYK